MPGLTLESLRAISTQANRELANAQQYHRSAMQKASATRQAYEEAQEVVASRQARAYFADSDGLLEAA